ncbi:MAG: hypothetical protein ACJ74T_20450, partial [Pyrinomonadaceae bacterium]
LNRQKVVSGATPLLDLSYDYLRPGTTGGRTGQLTRIVNNLDSTRRRDRNYEYDQLGRLKRATGGLALARRLRGADKLRHRAGRVALPAPALQTAVHHQRVHDLLPAAAAGA